MSDNAAVISFRTYCLGGPISMSRCKTCRHAANWAALNEMGDWLRKPVQAKMHRVDESLCAISGAPFYIPNEIFE